MVILAVMNGAVTIQTYQLVTLNIILQVLQFHHHLHHQQKNTLMANHAPTLLTDNVVKTAQLQTVTGHGHQTIQLNGHQKTLTVDANHLMLNNSSVTETTIIVNPISIIETIFIIYLIYN
jgi:hypothetical protein